MSVTFLKDKCTSSSAPSDEPAPITSPAASSESTRLVKNGVGPVTIDSCQKNNQTVDISNEFILKIYCIYMKERLPEGLIDRPTD